MREHTLVTRRTGRGRCKKNVKSSQFSVLLFHNIFVSEPTVPVLLPRHVKFSTQEIRDDPVNWIEARRSFVCAGLRSESRHQPKHTEYGHIRTPPCAVLRSMCNYQHLTKIETYNLSFVYLYIPETRRYLHWYILLSTCRFVKFLFLLFFCEIFCTAFVLYRPLCAVTV